MKIDLHLHTTASDGRLTPEELVRLAAEQDLNIIAITDHDTTEGIGPALLASRTYPQLRVIPGIEINTDVPQGEVHVLGYFVDYSDVPLQRTLERLRHSRECRAKRMIDKLAGLGLALEWSRVQELAQGGAFGRPHIAQALLEKGYIASFQEAFTKYIGRRGPAYVEREKLTPKEAVELVVRVKGLPVLAHPGDIPNLEDLLVRLKPVGLAGLEAYYDGYAPEVIQRLAQIAQKHDLIATGGSDYHSLGTATESLLGTPPVPEEAVQRLWALAGPRAQEFVLP